jgi:hypothetical protein
MHERRHPAGAYPVFGRPPDRRGDERYVLPLLETGMALAYLWPADAADVGDEVEVDIRGRGGRRWSVRRSWNAALGEARDRGERRATARSKSLISAAPNRTWLSPCRSDRARESRVTATTT